jgi:hypothetical protein
MPFVPYDGLWTRLCHSPESASACRTSARSGFGFARGGREDRSAQRSWRRRRPPHSCPLLKGSPSHNGLPGICRSRLMYSSPSRDTPARSPSRRGWTGGSTVTVSSSTARGPTNAACPPRTARSGTWGPTGQGLTPSSSCPRRRATPGMNKRVGSHLILFPSLVLRTPDSFFALTAKKLLYPTLFVPFSICA